MTTCVSFVFVERLPRCIPLLLYCFMVLISLRWADDDKSIETILSHSVKDQGSTANLYKHASTGLCVIVSVWIPSMATSLLYARSGVTPNSIQLLTRSTHNACLPRAYMGIHKQQEDGAWGKFWIRPSRGHSLEPDRETAPSTGFQCDWKPTQNLPPPHTGKVLYLTLNSSGSLCLSKA